MCMTSLFVSVHVCDHLHVHVHVHARVRGLVCLCAGATMCHICVFNVLMTGDRMEPVNQKHPP